MSSTKYCRLDMSNSLIRAENNIAMIRHWQVDLSFAFHMWYILDRAYWLQNTLPLQSYTSKIVATRLRSYVATNLVPRVLMNILRSLIHEPKKNSGYAATSPPISLPGFSWMSEDIALRMNIPRSLLHEPKKSRYTSIFFVMSNRSGYADTRTRTSRIKKQNTTLIVLSEIPYTITLILQSQVIKQGLLWSFCQKYNFSITLIV